MQFIITLIIVSIIAALSACGGGSGMADANPAPNGYTAESGLAQKGPLMQGSQITINELSTPNFQPTGRSFSLEVSSNDGKFNPSGIYFVSPYLSTSALGYYFNEISGLPSSDVVFLRGLSDLSAGADTVINVNALSSISKSRILNLVTGTNLLNPSTGLAYSSPPAKLPFGSARTQAQAENLKAFYIYNDATLLSGKNAQPANFTALDLSQNRAADQILAAFSAVAMTAGQNGNGVNTLLSQIEADFADDGLLNNSPKYPQSVSSRLCAAAAGTNFAAVAANLNNFYGTKYQPTDLSQWVDTSGCVDQVIDKYKFSASNVAAGTVSKSPAYIVGPDDVGQCFSVGGLTGTATAGLYYNGAANPVAATQLAKLGDRMELGLNVSSATGTASAFIQRSAPVAYGTCPTAAPSGGVTRVQKYTAYGSSAPSDEGQTLNNFINLLRSGFRQSSRLMDDRVNTLKSRADKLVMDNVGDGLSVINKYLNDCSYTNGILNCNTVGTIFYKTASGYGFQYQVSGVGEQSSGPASRYLISGTIASQWSAVNGVGTLTFGSIKTRISDASKLSEVSFILNSTGAYATSNSANLSVESFLVKAYDQNQNSSKWARLSLGALKIDILKNFLSGLKSYTLSGDIGLTTSENDALSGTLSQLTAEEKSTNSSAGKITDVFATGAKLILSISTSDGPVFSMDISASQDISNYFPGLPSSALNPENYKAYIVIKEVGQATMSINILKSQYNQTNYEVKFNNVDGWVVLSALTKRSNPFIDEETIVGDMLLRSSGPYTANIFTNSQGKLQGAIFNNGRSIGAIIDNIIIASGLLISLN